MMGDERIKLEPSFFDRGWSLVEGGLKATAFTYSTGVRALQMSNQKGSIIVLPYQGHQIWSAEFDDHELGMESLIGKPVQVIDDPKEPAKGYMSNYGGFVIHCGARRMGCPDMEEGDEHLLHGVLPNAEYCDADIIHRKGVFISVTGRLCDKRADVSGSYKYSATPLTTLYADSSLVEISMVIHNLFDGPMEIMRLEHVNFRGVPGSELVYSAPCTPDSVRIRTKYPSHAPPTASLLKLIEEMQKDPSVHNKVEAESIYDPELVLYLKYQADKKGWAHSMQVMPDGYAHYISHMPSQFPIGIRWIRTKQDADKDFPVTNAMGLLLPATAEPEGYAAEKRKGNVIEIAKGKRWGSRIIAGLLEPREVRRIRKTIDDIG